MDKFVKYMPLSNFPQNKGAAIQFGMSVIKTQKNRIVGTVEMAPQVKAKPAPGSSESPFDWKDGKLFMMLEDREIGSLLTVLRGIRLESKIVHKYPTDAQPDEQTVSSLEFKMPEGGPDIGVKMEQKKAGEKEFKRITIYLKPEDVQVLVVLFEEVIKHMYKTGTVESTY